MHPSERTGNLLLDALPTPDLARLVDEAPARTLKVGDVVQEADTPIESVHFPINGVLSVVTTLEGGTRQIEAATIGREGVSNVHVVVGSRRSGGQRTVSQVEVAAYVVPVDRIVEEMARDGKLCALLHGYVQALWAQAAHCAACNALHDVTRRCCRWLLQTHDRVRADSFFLTQEYLAAMLGVERSTVSVAAGELQRRGLIAYSRGRIRILDREGLETATCECYERMRSEYSRLVPLG